MSKVAYIGAFLDADSRRRLIENSGPQPGQRVYGDHVTLSYKPDHETLERWKPLLGKEVEIEVLSGRSDVRGHARLARLPDGLPCENGAPHITISCAPNTKPVYSNQLLAGATDDRPRGEKYTLVVKATIDTYPRTQGASNG